MSEIRYGYRTDKCSICGDITMKYEIVPTLNDLNQETGVVDGDIVNYGKCKVYEKGEIPSWANCPFVYKHFTG